MELTAPFRQPLLERTPQMEREKAKYRTFVLLSPRW
jgi:hypothetical protein